jgi:hypothetical protein
MSENTSVVPSFVSAMNADVNVGMNEVVSVFVSKYEDGLFAKKDELSKKIKGLKSSLADLTKWLEGSVNKDQYTTTMFPLGISSRVTGIEIIWTDTSYNYKEKNTINVVVGVFDNSSDSKYPSFSKTFTTKISKQDIDHHTELENDLESVNGELMEVMSLIKSVSRKERQIRGRISEMKLEQSGFSDLINNPEMVKLIQIN